MARPLVKVQLNDQEKMVTLPAVFTAPIRTDIVQYVHTNMNKNKRQAYAVSPDAGMQHSALSWGTGRAVSRIPRVKGHGTRRSGQGAFGNMCRGGRMFAPTKTWRKWHRKISKGQRRYATVSAVAATAVPALVMARGHSINGVAEIPLVVANDCMYSIEKTKDAVELLAQLGADADVERVKLSKKIRVGRGKARNRKFVQRKGPLIVYGREDSRITQVFRNIPGVELCNVSRLNLLQLAPGGHLGRFVVWTEDAFEQLDSIFGTYDTPSEQKTGFKLPQPIMANTDVTGIINSDEVQSVLRPKIRQNKFTVRKKNPLNNLGAMVKLNPYVLTQRRRAVQQKAAADATRKYTVSKMADSYKDYLFGQ